MDGKVIQQIRDTLIARWKKIGTDQGRQNSFQQEGGDPHAEIIDIAQALEQMGRDSSLQEAERREVVAIERALAKMATGNFGVCEECTEEIPARRLIVLPEARLCAQCQAYEERQNARMRTHGIAAR